MPNSTIADVENQDTQVTTNDERGAATGQKTGFAHKLYTGQLTYQFIPHRKRWYVVTVVIILVALGGLIFRGLNLGIDFRGGVEFRANVSATSASADDIRRAVLDTGLPELDGTQVVELGSDQVQIQTRALDSSEVTTLKKGIAKASGSSESSVTYSKVGSQWGSQITKKAVQALVVFLVLVMLLIWAYFREWKMSVTAMLGLLNNLIVTLGVYALVGFAFTPATLIGMLTILGYSLYDTVVVFDKVRELTRDLDRSPYTYDEAVNRALNQVFVRSVNTTIIGVLPVAALLFTGVFVLGSGPLQDLGMALFVGMLAGGYSSIFVATPLLTEFRRNERVVKDHDAKVLRRRTKEERAADRTRRSQESNAEVGGSSADDAADEAEAPSSSSVAREAAESSTSSASSARPQPRRMTRSQRKK
ncbi:MAG: protein translocase subunit SecF [Cutibacterium granulosum]|uniref:protein translocase subunit SecF n=1 Tax=Cutibacterium granulosum TaxID=33011 RepID=UPI002B223333|nr:protein translocase subunit SecF [Cutibacterium granulosum]MEA5647890.1 protein translocase subunit SecF [Cutibacterium granulosum]MEA5653971.1 protein translocase subunit SecF [Cutibacterium granulosum]MEA5662318.1 protein translocase subunit SecF [Cutibacterium granulosum]MEA5665052.1 protein translocase subunit SecF [Cutibacterium granulosum]